MDIALEFQRITALAMRSDYSRTDLFDRCPSLRLATTAINRGDAFAEDMATIGHVFHFSLNHQGDIREEINLEVPPEAPIGDLSITDAPSINIRAEPDHPDIEDLVHKSKVLSKPPSDGILSWLKTVHRQSRGFELGTFDASLLAVTMKQQSIKWRDLALGYVSDIITMVHVFTTDLLEQITPSRNVRVGIEALLMDELTKRYQIAVDRVKFLLDVELEGNPATHNHYFNDTLRKRYMKFRG